MTERITPQNVKALALAVQRLAEGRGLIPLGGQLAVQKGSPANGIHWRLTGREPGSGGLIELPFLPDKGFLGKTAADAYVRLQFTQAALKAFPQTVRLDGGGEVTPFPRALAAAASHNYEAERGASDTHLPCAVCGQSYGAVIHA